MSTVAVPVNDPAAARTRAHSPRTRTCVGCRQRADAADLLRVAAVRVDGVLSVVPNHHGRWPGRGARVHPTAECLDLAIRRRAFVRALRLEDEPDVTAVREWVRTTEIDGRPRGPVGRQ